MDLVGQTLSHYRITGEISRGGMGIVYRATDTRLNREVALKVLPEDLIHDPERRRRFLQEAQAASAIEHPNVAVIYDADEADGRTFIAMELVRGQKLSDWLPRHKPSVAQALELATEIAAGLSRAHERQIVHRDLKPANIMVTDDGHAKIIDFGIAKLIEASSGAADETRASNSDTASGVVLGTMTYMSPEQARGEKVDARTDVFSFGIVLHEMLAGQPPFQGRSGVETAAAIIHAPHPRLAPLASGVVADVTPDLQRIVDKCLEKDPANRYQSMKDLVVDLRATRRRLESGTQPATTMTQAAVVAAPPARRGSMMWILAGGSVIVAMIVGGVLWRARTPAVPAPGDATAGPKKPSVAVMYFDNTTGAPDMNWLRTGIPDMVVTDLSQSADLEVVSTDRVYAALASLKKANDATISPEVVNQVAAQTGADHVIVGSYMKAGDQVRLNVRLQEVRTGHIVTSESVQGPSQSDLFKMVDDLSHRLRAKFEELRPAPKSTSLLSQPGAVVSPMGGLDRGLGDVTTSSIEAYKEYAEGVDLHERFREEEATARFEKAIAIDPSFAMAYIKLAVVQGNNGRMDLSGKYAALALQHADRLTPRERYYIEGYYYTRKADTFARGIDAYKKCVELDPGQEACRHNLGLNYQALEKFQESAEQYEELIRRGDTNPTAYDNLANAYIALGATDKAVAVTEQSARRNPENGAAHRTYGYALIAGGRYDDALKELSQAEIFDPTDASTVFGVAIDQIHLENWSAARAVTGSLESSPNQTRRWLGGLASSVIAGYAGQCAEAAAAADRAIAAFKVPSVNTAYTRLLSANVLTACGRPDAAAAALEKVESDAPGDPVLLTANVSRAIALAAAGRMAQADDALGKAAALITPLMSGPDNREVAWGRGAVSLARKDYVTAIGQLQQAQNALPAGGTDFAPTDHVPIWFALGEAYLRAGKAQDAATWFQKVVDRSLERQFQPFEYVRSLYYLGTIREQAGDTAGAREAYRRFVGYWKDGTIDRDHIADAQRKLQTLK